MCLDCIEDPPEDSFKPDTKLSLNVKARLIAEELAWQQLVLLLLVYSNLARFARWQIVAEEYITSREHIQRPPKFIL